VARRHQDGFLFVRGKRRKKWVARWRESMLSEDGTIRDVQKSEVIGFVSELSKSEAQDELDKKLRAINGGSYRPKSTILFEKFVETIWKPGVLSLLKPGSSKYYAFQLDHHLVPAFGQRRLCEITRADVQVFVAEKRSVGYSGSYVHGMHTTLGKVLESAVESDYLERNPARGVKVGSREPVRQTVFLSAQDSVKLIAYLEEPVRTIVLVAVLTGLRIGELLALRWKNIDFLRETAHVRETVSEGRFGTPKTKSSRRDLPISAPVREAFVAQRRRSRQTGPDDLVFATHKLTPLNQKNLLRRQLRPACAALKLPPVSWHSFRHTHATALGEVGESVKTAQALLGHSDLETTLNIYTHAIPESQRRAVEGVAKILFPNVPKSSESSKRAEVN